MSAGDKAINYLSMLLGSAVGITLSLFIYRRTMARARELAREEAAENGVAVDGELDEELDLGYGDLEEGRRQRAGEADEAALMDDDDISLWETDAVDGGYKDDSEEEDAAGKGNGKISNGEHR